MRAFNATSVAACAPTRRHYGAEQKIVKIAHHSSHYSALAAHRAEGSLLLAQLHIEDQPVPVVWVLTDQCRRSREVTRRLFNGALDQALLRLANAIVERRDRGFS